MSWASKWWQPEKKTKRTVCLEFLISICRCSMEKGTRHFSDYRKRFPKSTTTYQYLHGKRLPILARSSQEFLYRRQRTLLNPNSSQQYSQQGPGQSLWLWQIWSKSKKWAFHAASLQKRVGSGIQRLHAAGEWYGWVILQRLDTLISTSRALSPSTTSLRGLGVSGRQAEIAWQPACTLGRNGATNLHRDHKYALSNRDNMPSPTTTRLDIPQRGDGLGTKRVMVGLRRECDATTGSIRFSIDSSVED